VTFTLTITDPPTCEPPTSTTPSALSSQSYEKGEPEKVFTWNSFVTNPTSCADSLLYTVTYNIAGITTFIAEDYTEKTLTVFASEDS
jgi:hypothetical protein